MTSEVRSGELEYAAVQVGVGVSADGVGISSCSVIGFQGCVRSRFLRECRLPALYDRPGAPNPNCSRSMNGQRSPT